MKRLFIVLLAVVVLGLMMASPTAAMIDASPGEPVVRIPNNPGPGCGGCECLVCYEMIYNHSPIRMLGGRKVQSIAPPDKPVDSGAWGFLPEGWDCSPGLCSCDKRDLISLPGQFDRDGTPLGYIKLTKRFGCACSMSP